MTELLTLAILFAIWTAIIRTIRKLFPGALPTLANLGLRTPLRRKFFGPASTLRAAGIQKGWNVLEIGPGWGFLTQGAAEQVGDEGQVVGIDIDTRMLRRCQERVDIPYDSLHLTCGDGARLPFPSHSFDSALLVSVLGEVRDRKALFRELKRCLKPGASAVVNELALDPDYVFPWTVARFGEEAGFDVVEKDGNILCHTTKLRKPDGSVA